MNAMTINLARMVIHTCSNGFGARFGKNAQYKMSPKFAPVRALRLKAPMMPAKIRPYIASTLKRVNAHMNISKFSPRLERGRVLVAILCSKCIAQNDGEDIPCQSDIYDPLDI